MMRSLTLAAFLVFVATASAQRQTTGQQSLGNALGQNAAGAGGFQGGNATPGELSTDAGGEAGVNRDFGEGLVGRGDTADRFVGNQDASATGRATNRADFSGLNRQRATPPTPPASPVRATIRLNLNARGGAALPISRSMRTSLLASSRVVTGRALDNVSPAIRYSATPTATVLTGTAQTRHDRKLAEAILRLQPGVRRIENRIVVPPAVPPIP